MDENKHTDNILDMKLDNTYNRNERVDNFFELNEITVTITLAEYRKLVADNATYREKMSRYWDEKLDLKAEIDRLNEQIEKLESER